jgi:similar to spore coat protein
MVDQNMSLHETMEVHEMLNFKTVCMTQSKMAQGIVFDQDLKALMEQDVQQSMAAIKELQGLLTRGKTTLH